MTLPWKREKRTRAEGDRPQRTAPVQMRPAQTHPFRRMDGYVPLHRPEFTLYRSIREAIPVVDAAVLKLVRLAGGVGVRCGDGRVQEALNDFLRTVPAGWSQRGIQSFLDSYLDCLLTCGRAVGEIVPTADGKDIAAVLCGSVEDVEVREGKSPLDVKLARREKNGEITLLPRQDLLLFTPYCPSPEEPYGVSLLHSMPFLSNVLLKIYQTLGTNWERAGNVRFAVVYKPGEEGADGRRVQERSQLIAQRWSEAMQSTRSGTVRDFVTVGDVDIKAIGTDRDLPDCQAPARLIIEQLISQTGIPPFLLGLNWSSTERMSSQQADIMTSEITALRRTVTPVVERVCRMWLRMHGEDCPFTVEWEDINLQDQVEEARAELYRRQAEDLAKNGRTRRTESPDRAPKQEDPEGSGDDKDDREDKDDKNEKKEEVNSP